MNRDEREDERGAVDVVGSTAERAAYEARRQRREQWTSGVILALFTVAAVVEAVLVWMKGTGR